MLSDINKTIEKIHNYIYANDGLGNFEVLDELLKIFYLKTFDEQHEQLLEKSVNDLTLLENINHIFKELTISYPKLFEKNTKINLKNETLLYAIKELSHFTFTKLKSDIKGHIMQRVIDRSFREGLGQFFTPAPVVDFIVKMIQPKAGMKGCDPACGTGGFMFTSMEYMANNENANINDVIDNIEFYDISKSVVRLIGMRLMFEFGIDKPNVKIMDSISTPLEQHFDFVLTNPPFGTQGKIKDKNILSKYVLGHDDSGKLFNSQAPDLLFVEKVINILKEGGKGAIILPDGNFENPSSKYFRDYLLKNCKIDAIISLPDGTFIPYGTGVKSSILFLTKKKNCSLDYNVFLGKINNLGYTFSKHSKSLTDKDGNIIDDSSRVLDSYLNEKYDLDNFIINIQDMVANNNNFSQHFYSPRINNEILSLIGTDSVRLGDYVDVVNKKIKIDPNKIYRYVEISDVNASGCEIINYTEMEGSDLPSRASFKLEKDQIIVAIAGNAIGTIWNTKAIVTEEYADCICTNGFIVLKAKNISPYLLLHFFNSEVFRVQVRKYKYGTAIPTISKEDFLNIRIPNYTNEMKEKIIKNMEKAFALKIEIKKLLSMNELKG